jgi:hypothetical protein
LRVQVTGDEPSPGINVDQTPCGGVGEFSGPLHDRGTSNDLYGLRSDQHLTGLRALLESSRHRYRWSAGRPGACDTRNDLTCLEASSKVTRPGQGENPLSGLVGG